MLARHCGGGICASIHLSLENGHDEIRALREMTVDGAKTDARLFGNFTNRSVRGLGVVKGPAGSSVYDNRCSNSGATERKS